MNQAHLDYAKAHKCIGRVRLERELGIKQREARAIVAYLKESHVETPIQKTSTLSDELAIHGLTVAEFEKMFEVKKESITKKTRKVNNKFTVGIIGDTHCCDKSHAIDELHDYYRIAKEEGVEVVLHAGDITAGIDIYKGQAMDLLAFGFDDQLKWCKLNYPQIDGIETIAISGNHDLGFKATAGANFVEALSNLRPDIIYAGDYDALVDVNGVNCGLHHGAQGNAYALSYKLQKYIEKIGGGQKPQIYILGHYHAALQMFYRNIHCFMPACFQKPNDFSVRLGLPNCIGGYIAEIETADDEQNSILSIKSKFISYY